MRVNTPVITLSLKSACIGLVLFFMSTTIAFANYNVEQLSKKVTHNGSMAILSVESYGNSVGKKMAHSTVIDIDDNNC